MRGGGRGQGWEENSLASLPFSPHFFFLSLPSLFLDPRSLSLPRSDAGNGGTGSWGSRGQTRDEDVVRGNRARFWGLGGHVVRGALALRLASSLRLRLCSARCFTEGRARKKWGEEELPVFHWTVKDRKR